MNPYYKSTLNTQNLKNQIITPTPPPIIDSTLSGNELDPLTYDKLIFPMEPLNYEPLDFDTTYFFMSHMSFKNWLINWLYDISDYFLFWIPF